MSPYQFGSHDLQMFASLKRIHKQVTLERAKKAQRFPHKWYPDDGKPLLGLNEGSDRREKPYIVLRKVIYVHALLTPIEIEAGFKSDLGSIPWLCQIVPGMKPIDPGCRHYLVHDWGYQHQLAERLILDAILQSGLIADGLPYWKARAIYYGVRLGGWSAYNRYARIAKRVGEPERKW